jgi:hypothetical protein
MEIHHLTMFNESILVLLSRSCHDGHTLKEVTQDPTATFHPQPAYYARCSSSDIERVSFAKIVKYICFELGKMAPMTISKLIPVYIPVDDLDVEDFLGTLDDDEELGAELLSSSTLKQDEDSIFSSIPIAGIKSTTTMEEEDDDDSF